MISNDRQLAVADRKLAELESAAAEMQDAEDAAVYLDLAQELRSKIESYVAARDGVNSVFEVRSVDDLGSAAIYARVAKGWTQKQLAEELDVSEQMVQKDEARRYEKAGVAKVAEVLDVLGYELVGFVRPVRQAEHASNSVSFIAAFGGVEPSFPLALSIQSAVEHVGRTMGPYVATSGHRVDPVFTSGFWMLNAGSSAQTWERSPRGRLSMLIEPANLRIRCSECEPAGRTVGRRSR